MRHAVFIMREAARGQWSIKNTNFTFSPASQKRADPESRAFAEVKSNDRCQDRLEERVAERAIQRRNDDEVE